MSVTDTAQNSKLKAWQAAAGPLGDALLGRLDWAIARKNYVDQMQAVLPAPDGVSFSSIDMDGVPALVVIPDTVVGNRALFYMHGGGYVHGGPGMYRALAGYYAKGLSATVYIPDYRQAPEFPFPTPIEDVFKAYRALFAMGHRAHELAISGDSAGGALVVTIMRWAKRAGVPLPVAGVALSPWADLTHSGLSAKSRDGLDPLVGTQVLNLLARTFLGKELATHPDASPVYADVRGLAPVLIQMGENEVMLDGGIALASRLAEQRVRTTLEVWPGMFHVWHSLVGHLPEADEALANAVAFILKELDRNSQVG
ncbi:alpha/beta hydrolase [Variovorax sp.]|uniref:alpha/beta hydrolase n=1 Tax=Variovorax sp. TaxID=1871043 RepID=UPI003BAD7370